MPMTWLNTHRDMDYQPDHVFAATVRPGKAHGSSFMKFSTRIDTDLPAESLFGAIGDFAALERMLIGRGATVTRIDPAREPGVGLGWMIGFDWRGKARQMRLTVSRFDRPERMTLTGQSEALDLSVAATVVALSRARARLILETDIRPRTMRARLMLQTAKLGKAQLDRRYHRRIEEFVRQMAGPA